MPIPKFHEIFLPLLKYLGDENEYSMQNIVLSLSEQFKLTDDEKSELLPSGSQPIFSNRVGWARTYLKKAGLLDVPRRAHVKITEEGLQVLKDNPTIIDIKFLEKYPGFYEFRYGSKDSDDSSDSDDNISPEEQFEKAYLEIRKDIADDLLKKIKNNPPEFFEKLVVDLLINMGYGGSRKDAGEAVGKSGDEGIDGIIKEDKLGLDVIYIQAKRFDNAVVSSADIQRFAGALQGKGAKKGVFITTSKFSKPAIKYAEKITNKIALIDGENLAQLMIDFDLGVSKIKSYEIKQIDLDYFES